MEYVQVVTGGTSGMGYATAKALAGMGPVLVGGRNTQKLNDAVENLRKTGVNAHGCRLDVSDRVSVEEFAAFAQDLGAIGNVVHAAGVDFDTADAAGIAQINVVGTVNVVEVFYPLIEKGFSLASYSSVTGRFYNPTDRELAVWNNPNDPDLARKFVEMLTMPEEYDDRLGTAAPAYFASKRFVMHYTMANAQRFANRGCRIFSVGPGSFATPMLEHQEQAFDSIKKSTVFGRFGDPDEMAVLFVDLLDPAVSYLTGTDVLMDGGLYAKRMVPQLD